MLLRAYSINNWCGRTFTKWVSFRNSKKFTHMETERNLKYLVRHVLKIVVEVLVVLNCNNNNANSGY